MCYSLADGGRRCRIRKHLEPLGLDEVRPDQRDDRPDVDWGAEQAPAHLWQKHPDRVAAEAMGSLLDVRDEEERITTDVMTACTAEGRRPHGLEFRMKSPSSLARKINERVDRNDLPPGEVADRLTDLIRYTVACRDHGRLTETAQDVVESMQRSGYRVIEAESTYVDGNPYKGLHMLLQGPGESTRTFELQVHSELSQRTKDEIHLDYEVFRDTKASRATREAAWHRMVEASSHVPNPAGLADLHELGGVKVEQVDRSRSR